MSAPIRKYQLFIGYSKELDVAADNKLAGTGASTESIDLQTIPKDENFIELNALQMKAVINFPKEGTNSKNPKQTIEIVNPTQETTAKIKNRNVLLLNAGYESDEGLPVICATQIQSSVLVKKGDTTTLKLTCADAYKVKRNVRISKSYVGTLTYGDVVTDLLKELAAYGVPSKPQIDPLFNIQLNTCMAFSDGIFEALEDILKPINYRWFMASGILYVEPVNKTLEGESEGEGFTRVLTINEDNVKDTIQQLQDTTNKNISESKADGLGIRVKINLNGEASGGDALRVTYGPFKGQYKITSVKHQMDFEGAAWDTIIECSKL